MKTEFSLAQLADPASQARRPGAGNPRACSGSDPEREVAQRIARLVEHAGEIHDGEPQPLRDLEHRLASGGRCLGVMLPFRKVDEDDAAVPSGCDRARLPQHLLEQRELSFGPVVRIPAVAVETEKAAQLMGGKERSDPVSRHGFLTPLLPLDMLRIDERCEQRVELGREAGKSYLPWCDCWARRGARICGC